MQLLDAFALASEVHHNVIKKGTEYPFLYHPLAVAALVLKYGGNEAQVQAAFLHDTISDSEITPQRLTEKFGAEVSRLAYAFSDPQMSEEVARDWQKTRQAYLDKIASQDDDALLVVACEELHELGELMSDLRRVGADAWQRFSAPPHAVFWYFREIMVLCNRRLTAPRYQGLVGEYGAVLRRFQRGLFEGASF